MALVSQAAFASMHGVSRKSVTVWKQGGYLVLRGDQIVVEESDRKLQDAKLGRFKPVTKNKQGNNKVTSKTGNYSGNNLLHEAVMPGKEIDPDNVSVMYEFINNVLAGEYVSQAEAEKVKENALALKNLLDARLKASALIEIETAQGILFELFREQRDAWLNWPTRIGPLVAADFDLDADKMTEALTQYVHQHITELGEPQVGFTAGENQASYSGGSKSMDTTPTNQRS